MLKRVVQNQPVFSQFLPKEDLLQFGYLDIPIEKERLENIVEVYKVEEMKIPKRLVKAIDSEMKDERNLGDSKHNAELIDMSDVDEI